MKWIPSSTATINLAGLLLLLITLYSSCQEKQSSKFGMLQQVIPETIDFNFHIKPILSDRCFACHGPDKNNRKADLALHLKETALAELKDKPGEYAIVPGKLSQSDAYQRIISDDPEYQMPPPESNLSLSDYEIALIQKWIEQGADYAPHWSFITPKKKTPPKPNKKWGNNEIDQFVLARLERMGLNPSPAASKETLIRRLSFSIRGLPPSMEEVQSFLADESPDAYERLVDQFLISSAYGERMAAHWLDIARYADSDGYLDDKHRDFSPWRDWVIDAFNKNLSYKDFITYQLAGDLLPDATQEQILATAFNRLHKKNSEAGIVFEEFRIEYVADRTNTVGKAILGLSMECARCHDHKYDPISQKNYFELFAFFNSTREIGHAVYGPDQTPGPALMLTDEEVDAQLDFINKLVNDREEILSQQKEAAQPSFDKWLDETKLSKKEIGNNLKKLQLANYSFESSSRQSKEVYHTPNTLKKGEEARLVNPIFRPGPKGNALFIEDFTSGRLAKGVGLFERTDPFSIDLWVYPDTIYDEAGIFLHCENLRLGYKGYSLHVKENKLSFIIAHSWPQNAIQITSKEALPVREWTKVTITYDGSSQAGGVRLYLNGLDKPVDVEQDNLYKGIIFEWNIHTYGFNGFTFGLRGKVKTFKNGGLDEMAIYNEALTPLEVLHLFDQDAAQEQLAKTDYAQNDPWLKSYYFARIDQSTQVSKDSLFAARARQNELYNSIPEIMVMGDLPEPRPTFILDRGIYDSPAEEVFPNTPESILPFSKELPKNRLGLAQWLFDEQNPITARVIVNQIWQLHFGKGIVKTSDDFGNQGDLPTHPELLDWLSLWFMENDWDLKALHKLILSSSTFQQSSAIDSTLLELDPENDLLARGPRFRLPAEMIRDNVLAISDLLVNKEGGKSVYPYQPEGLWDEITNKSWRYKYLQEPGDGLYRRSIYSIWKRTSPPPSLLIFDIADRDVCTVRRQSTSTPLQALVLLNDPQYQEAARMLAQRVIQTKGENTREQLSAIFQLIMGRAPRGNEIALIEEYYQKELDNYCTDQQAAYDYLRIGETPWDNRLAPEPLAALGVLANSLMNTYEASMLQ